MGIDLGIASEHTIGVLSGDGSTLAKRKAVQATESLAAIEEVALRGAVEGTRLAQAGATARCDLLHPSGDPRQVAPRRSLRRRC